MFKRFTGFVKDFWRQGPWEQATLIILAMFLLCFLADTALWTLLVKEVIAGPRIEYIWNKCLLAETILVPTLLATALTGSLLSKES